MWTSCTTHITIDCGQALLGCAMGARNGAQVPPRKRRLSASRRRCTVWRGLRNAPATSALPTLTIFVHGYNGAAPTRRRSAAEVAQMCGQPASMECAEPDELRYAGISPKVYGSSSGWAIVQKCPRVFGMEHSIRPRCATARRRRLHRWSPIAIHPIAMGQRDLLHPPAPFDSFGVGRRVGR